MKYDVCIIGGGAAGLAAAASFHKDINICILEKNAVLGRKLFVTGGGRCNLTNKSCENKEMALGMFRKLGIETRCDEEGRYYPYSGRAADVVRALKNSLGNNVAVKCDFPVKCVLPAKKSNLCRGKFVIEGREKIFADRVVIAAGGKAAPHLGTTGDGYAIAKSLGHTVTRIYPILTGIECAKDGVNFNELKGIRARGEVSLYKDGSFITKEKGEIQFTSEGLSGICIFNLTPYIKAENGESFKDALKKFSISVDLAPDFTRAAMEERDSTFGILTEKLADVVAPKEIKDWKLKVEGVRGWKEAQATCGGISTDEVNTDTMESKLIPGVYFAGEILDIQGPCGGYNLQNAWETGIKVAEAINNEIQN